MPTDTSKSRLEILGGLDAEPHVSRLDAICYGWLRGGLHWLEVQGYIIRGESDKSMHVRYTITPEGKTRLNEHREGFTLPGSTTTKG